MPRDGGRVPPKRPGGAGRDAPRTSSRVSGQTRGGAARSLVEEIRSTARPSQAEQAVHAFERAVDLLERGRDAVAAAAAEEAKSLAPRSGAVREVLGIALYRTERYRDALRELQAFRRITGRVDQNHLIADCHRALGVPEKAIEPARAAIRARIPEEARAEAAVVGASALADMGRFDEAIGLLRAFPVQGKMARPFDLRIWYVAGDVLERSGRLKEASAEFRRVVRADPGAFDAAERLARLG